MKYILILQEDKKGKGKKKYVAVHWTKEWQKTDKLYLIGKLVKKMQEELK